MNANKPPKFENFTDDNFAKGDELMADSKWIAGLTPDMQAIDAARAVLAARLGVVRHYFPLAVHEADLDVENVHQLRVATRRAAAALRIFQPLLGNKALKRVKSIVRDVRQAAADARDWDVFVHMVDHSTSLQEKPALAAANFLSAYAFGQRTASQMGLTHIATEKIVTLDEVCDELPDCVENDHTEDLASLAESTLTELFFTLTTGAETVPADPLEMHQFRILGKRVRYAMEVFVDCYTEPFKQELYPAVEQLQECLGAIQDGHTATTRLTDLFTRLQRSRPETAKQVKVGFASWKAELRRQIATGKRDFRTWTRDWQKLMVKYPLPMLALDTND